MLHIRINYLGYKVLYRATYTRLYSKDHHTHNYEGYRAMLAMLELLYV
jgi:hypothetical protein